MLEQASQKQQDDEEKQASHLTLKVANCALFLDLDGTLAPFAATPQAVVPTPRRTNLLLRLNEILNERLAVISGRSIDEIDRILERAIMTVAGVHGLQWRDRYGHVRETPGHSSLPQAVDLFASFTRAHQGVVLEVKPLSVALHYRKNPEIGPLARQIAVHVADACGLHLQEGSMVVELLTPGRDKGDAVKTFMAEAPFRGAIPVFIGDDLTDEKGFAAAIAMGGVGIIVGSRQNTLAHARLSDVDAVIAWLEQSAENQTFHMELMR
ncbi:trehalose-phosphatase [Terrarubrum flagellatum]|uniref:trehalose-phosphatase n=1 Tax=Terrirubrum flagellatum TaxID=2895980 RepID=UPI0031452DFB